MSRKLDQREGRAAFWGASLLCLNFLVTVISMSAGTFSGQAGYWRIVTAVIILAAALCYIRVFDRHFVVLSRIYIALTIIATLVYFYELSRIGLNVPDFATQELQFRYSQFLFPLALGFLATILWKDQRAPKIIGAAMYVASLLWMGYFFSAGNVDWQVKLSFAYDVAGFIAYLAFIGWMFLFWYAEKDDDTSDY